MISLFIMLSLLTSVKTFGTKELQVQKVKPGESVTIKCDVGDESVSLWFKQSFGEVPRWVLRHNRDSVRRGVGFNDGRFSADTKLLNLTIKEMKEGDTGTYFCAEVTGSSLHFGSGTLLIVEAEEMERRRPTVTLTEDGESLTLQCSVQAFTSSCEEQRVYWFGHGPGESHPGIVYTHGDGSDECKKSSEAASPPQSCVYTLPNRKITTSQNATFHCAVAACGRIIITNGTKITGVQIKGTNQWIVFALTTSNIIFLIVILVLVPLSLQKQRKGNSDHHPNATNQNGDDDDDVLNYTAVSFAKKPSSPRTSRDEKDHVIYSQVQIK